MPEAAQQNPAQEVEPDFLDELQEKIDSIIEETKDKLSKLREEIENWWDGSFEKDGVTFKEMDFSMKGDVFDYFKRRELEEYIANIDQKVRFENGIERIGGALSARELVDKFEGENFTPEEIFWLKKYILATSAIESGHNYGGPAGTGEKIDYKSKHKGDKALGRYQIMPKNWIAWSELYLDGRVVEPTVAAQEYIAYKRIVDYYEATKDKFEDEQHVFTMMANIWHGSPETVAQPRLKNPLKVKPTLDLRKYLTSEEIPVSTDYSKKILKEMELYHNLETLPESGISGIINGTRKKLEEWKDRAIEKAMDSLNPFK